VAAGTVSGDLRNLSNLGAWRALFAPFGHQMSLVEFIIALLDSVVCFIIHGCSHASRFDTNDASCSSPRFRGVLTA
jgi:hypothetical protein